MAEKEIKLAKFARVDGRPGKPLEGFGINSETFFPKKEKVGDITFDVYEAPVEFVKHIIAQMPDRYKLYDSAPVMTSTISPNYSKVWTTFNPWYVNKKQYQAFDENGQPEKNEKTGEYLYKYTYEWTEKEPETFTTLAIKQAVAKNTDKEKK